MAKLKPDPWTYVEDCEKRMRVRQRINGKRTALGKRKAVRVKQERRSKGRS